MLFGQNPILREEVAIGFGFFTVSTAVGCAFSGWRSSYPGLLSGPDITPVVFIADTALIISDYICGENDGFESEDSAGGSASYAGSVGGSASYASSSSGSSGRCDRAHQVI